MWFSHKLRVVSIILLTTLICASCTKEQSVISITIETECRPTDEQGRLKEYVQLALQTLEDDSLVVVPEVKIRRVDLNKVETNILNVPVQGAAELRMKMGIYDYKDYKSDLERFDKELNFKVEDSYFTQEGSSVYIDQNSDSSNWSKKYVLVSGEAGIVDSIKALRKKIRKAGVSSYDHSNLVIRVVNKPSEDTVNTSVDVTPQVVKKTRKPSKKGGISPPKTDENPEVRVQRPLRIVLRKKSITWTDNGDGYTYDVLITNTAGGATYVNRFKDRNRINVEDLGIADKRLYRIQVTETSPSGSEVVKKETFNLINSGEKIDPRCINH